MTRKDRVDRMARLGVLPVSFLPTPSTGEIDTPRYLVPERAANMSPARWALDAGVRFSSHLDTPVTPMLPLQAVWQLNAKHQRGDWPCSEDRSNAGTSGSDD